jgi:ATP-dependent protease ClpP protease subunit
MEIWYTLTGTIERKLVQDAIGSITDDLYAKPVTSLRFLLASSGGEIEAGINLYAYLRALPIKVETIGFGEVDAAAVLIYLGGKHRLAVEGCQFFFHEGRYTVQEPRAPIHAHEEAIAVFKRELHEMIRIIAVETGNDGEIVADMLRRSKSMLAIEAKEFGLCHEVTSQMPLEQQQKTFGFGPLGNDLNNG